MNIAVIESQHGKGFGETTLINAIEAAKSKGYKTIEVGNGSFSALNIFFNNYFRRIS